MSKVSDFIGMAWYVVVHEWLPMWLVIAVLFSIMLGVVYSSMSGREERREQYIQECRDKGGTVTETMGGNRLGCEYK